MTARTPMPAGGSLRTTLLRAHAVPLRMAAKKSSSAAKRQGKAYTKTSRCWPGYEPVPGKSEHEEGSCRKKPASRNAGKPVGRETARKKQVARGGERAVQAKKKSPSAAERRSVAKTATRKQAARKRTTQEATGKKTPGRRNPKARSSGAKRAAA